MSTAKPEVCGTAKPKVCATAKTEVCAGLLARPASPAPRPGEVPVWQGQPCWRALAVGAFHIRAVSLCVCALVFANAVVARAEGLPPWQAVHDIAPLLLGGGLVVAGVAAAAWATGRTTLYTVTNQRLMMQYGFALTATLALPMRLIGAVAVSEGRTGDVPIRLKPGRVVGYAKLWPHARPWRLRRPEPMLRSLPDAGRVAAILSRTVAEAQAAAVDVPAQAGPQAPSRQLLDAIAP